MSEQIAREENSVLGTEHELTAIMRLKGTVARELLLNNGVTEAGISLIIPLFKKNSTTQTNNVADDVKTAIQDAINVALRHNHSTVDVEHLLYSLLNNKKFASHIIVERAGVKPAKIIEEILALFTGLNHSEKKQGQKDSAFDFGFDPNPPENDGMFSVGPISPLGQTTVTARDSALSLYSTNLTELARKGKIDPIVGREMETERIIQILSRRTKNNPVLIGDPGVGKTAIVEGLAQRTASGTVPHNLLGKEILSLDIGSLLAGTMYRGQFEARIKKILDEIKKKANVILFVDEIHTIVGAGSTEGSIDAANLLKPMLAKGELRMIGSTTFDEYKKHIERDPAFERRFQQVKVQEPSIQETIQILNGIKGRYESHHRVSYSPESIDAAAILSKRYIHDRFLPDKAIDLLDEAGAAVSILSKSSYDLTKLKNELRQILKQKDDFIMQENYKEATLLREKEIIIEKKISAISSELSKSKGDKIIRAEDIAKVVSKWTGVSVSNLTIEEKKKYLLLEKQIKKRIVGQDNAVKQVASALKRARVGISNPNRPIGCFIFLGPTGVGKSELAKTLAIELFGEQGSLIKIDMSEFMEKHNVSRLVGAPAGYIGYEEGGKLTETVRRNPFSLILLDEIEKAHPEVFNILLQIMEDGELTDAKGRKVDFKNSIIIMTSNLGTELINKKFSIGFNQKNSGSADLQKIEEDIHGALEREFKPEFINRLDQVVIFNPLSKADIQKIAKIQISDLIKRVESEKIMLSVSAKLIKYIAEEGFSPEYGARPIRKLIMELIETPLSELILKDKIVRNEKLKLDLQGDKVVFVDRSGKTL